MVSVFWCWLTEYLIIGEPAASRQPCAHTRDCQGGAASPDSVVSGFFNNSFYASRHRILVWPPPQTTPCSSETFRFCLRFLLSTFDFSGRGLWNVNILTIGFSRRIYSRPGSWINVGIGHFKAFRKLNVRLFRTMNPARRSTHVCTINEGQLVYSLSVCRGMIQIHLRKRKKAAHFIEGSVLTNVLKKHI